MKTAALKCAGRPAEIAVDQIRTISTQRLVRKVDAINAPTSEKLRRLIVEMYGMP